MAESPNHADALGQTVGILDQVGVELAFLEPGRDTGLLPINSFVMDLEEVVQADAPPVVAAAVAVVRRWLDLTLDGSGVFTAETIRDLGEWHAWMSSALVAWENGAPIPEPPVKWRSKPVEELAIPQPASPALPTPGEEPAIRLNLTEDLDLLREFHGESLELLQNIEQGVLRLEENPADAGTIHSIFRAFHTFKGGAGFLHLAALRDLAHDLESLLDAARRSELAITSEIIDLILAGGDALKQFTQEIGAQLQGTNAGSPIIVPTRPILQRVRAALRGEAAPSAQSARPVPSRVQPAAQPAPPPPAPPPAAVTSSAQAREAMAGGGSPPEAAAPSPEAKAGTSRANGNRGTTAAADGTAGFVKLDTRKLDNLVDLVGELVISQSMVVQDPDVQRLSSRRLARGLRQLSRITTELQRTAMSLRMVPIRGTFQKMTRLVRDLGAQQKKQVQLVLDGEETELDRNIVEVLSDPLIHMIRNSVDHGIEPPADRLARGKPAAGTIRLSAAHQRGGIVIRIEDDGLGLDQARILSKARERGLVKPNVTLNEPEVFALIFAPGFSTAETVTDVSGRGVGMDVVRRNIEKLRGKVEIQSVAGRGTTFTIVLPLTLAIIDGMLVGVGDDRYIIPTLAVRESFRPRPGMVTTVQERGEVVSVRGRLTPLLRLGQHLGTPARAVDPSDGIIVVVESGDDARGLLVDELLGKQEIVIKSLGDTFNQQNLLAGAAILGDGRVGLILDVDTLVKCRTHSA